jgi:starvation-inducible DNA-binding protein
MEVADGLSKVLADTFTLYLQTHYFHWNVTGPHFRALHGMFEEEYLELWRAVDVVAERIRALGLHAPGTYVDFGRLTSVQETTEVPTAEVMIRRLIAGHETVAHTARDAYEAAQAGGDIVSADLMTRRIEAHETTIWMLRSTLSD